MKMSKGSGKQMFFTGKAKMQMDNIISTGKGNFIGSKPSSAPKASVKKPSIGFGIGSGVAKKGPF